MIDQLEILSRSKVQFITLFFGAAQLCYAFYQSWQAARIRCRKTNFLAKPIYFNFFTINYTVWSHIVSTGGDALTLSPLSERRNIGTLTTSSESFISQWAFDSSWIDKYLKILWIISSLLLLLLSGFFFHFCKVGALVDHTQEDLAKFGYLSERKVIFFGRQCYTLMTCNNLCSNYGDFNFF